MRNTICFIAACIATACAAEEVSGGAESTVAPVISVSDVQIEQDAYTRLVTVSYELGDLPAIITVDFLTNGVSIGEANFNNVFGAVNRVVVQTNSVHTIHWQPSKSWPGHSGVKLSAQVTAWAQQDPPDYMVVSLGDKSVSPISYYVSTNAFPGTLADDVYRTSRLVMRRIRAANVRWQMGATKADYEQAGSTSSPAARETAHYVTLTYDYFIGIYAVTQEQYRRMTGASALGGFFKGYEDSAVRPRTGVNYDGLRGKNTGTGHDDLTSSCAIQKLRNLTGIDFDLPSDAEWEYACKAGTTWLLYTGKAYTQANVNEIAWNSNNSSGQTHPVGQKIPNEWGLYDMIGNTLEWCRDKYVEDLGVDDVVDPIGTTGDYRVVRGSRYNYKMSYARTTYRYGQNPSINTTSSETGAVAHGFRVMCPLTLKFPEPEAEEPGEDAGEGSETVEGE